MALYTLGLHPLLKVLEQKLPGLRIGNQAGHDLTRYRNLKED
jgi:hypothetical protein